MEADVVVATLNPVRQNGSYFYVWMAVVCALVAIGGFAPTYWLQLAAGTFVGPPLLHLHGALFTAWTLLLLSQTILAVQGRLDHHRAWGLVGISLATAMTIIGVAAAMHTLTSGLAEGYGNRSRAFLVLPVSAIVLFAIFFIGAIANIANSDAHKRLMLLATIPLLQAAMARVFFTLITGGGPGLRPGIGAPPPVSVALVPSLLAELLVVAGIAYDWRTRGQPHPTWLFGIVVITAVILLREPFSETHAWQSFADTLVRFAN